MPRELPDGGKAAARVFTEWTCEGSLKANFENIIYLRVDADGILARYQIDMYVST